MTERGCTGGCVKANSIVRAKDEYKFVVSILIFSHLSKFSFALFLVLGTQPLFS